jgi:hypothetical protein
MSLDADIKVVRDQEAARAIPLQVYQDLFWTLTDDQKEKLINAGLELLHHKMSRYDDTSSRYWSAVRAFVKLRSTL